MICLACQRPNEDHARFCEQCGHPLEIRCATCNTPTRPWARFCSQCGQQLVSALSEGAQPVPEVPAAPPGSKLDQLQKYLPRHLVEKILANRGRLQGERKLVTVLFADIVGYSTWSEQVGEEVLFAMMDELYELFIHEIHRYEGTVNELTGDGIVAFFGAPLAVEQAPLRAVRAALALQNAVARHNDILERQHGRRVQIRVGINTGPVIVGTVGNNLRMDYKAIGNTVNLAARMEQTAAPGTVQITAQTYRMVAGYVDCEDLGVRHVKGLATAVQTYRVLGERKVQSRLDVARRRGLTRLVGRSRELEQLRHCFALVQHGSGQAVSIIGDAGLGKSRLLYEFHHLLQGTESLWFEGRCSSYDSAVAYLPIVGFLQHYFGIDANDSDADIAQKVSQGFASLSVESQQTMPYVLHLLAAEMTAKISPATSPEVIKHRIFEALRLLVLENSLRCPVVLAIEDLHWIDKTSEEFLTFLLDHIAGARIFLLFTYRPEFVSTWSRKSYHNVVSLTRLVEHDSQDMLEALLHTGQIQSELKTFILDKTEGVPFFLEELVKSLQETAAIEWIDQQWRLKTPEIMPQIPDTIEELLTSRIDRLPEDAKHLLQLGAIIGREFREDLLKELSEVPDQQLAASVAALIDAELLYARRFPLQTTYTFKHAFTQEAAYHSILTARRCELHQRVAATLEAFYPDRLDEYYGQLAYHFFEGGQEHEKAINYAVRAGERAMTLLAYAEATRFYQMALQVLDCRESSEEKRRGALLLALGEAQRKAGAHVEALQTLQLAFHCAQRQDDVGSLAQAALEFEQATWRAFFSTQEVIPLLETALQRLGEGDSVLRAWVLGSLARALLYNLGVQQQAVELAQQAVAMARRVDNPEVLAFTLGVLTTAPWKPQETLERLAYADEMLHLAQQSSNGELISSAHTRRLECQLELGNIQAVNAEVDAMIQIDTELRQPSYLYLTVSFRVLQALLAGRFQEAEHLALQAREVAPTIQALNTEGTFGLQMFTIRREQGRLREIAPVLRLILQQQTITTTWRPGLALIYSELGLVDEAREEFERLAHRNFLDFPRDAMWVGCITYLVEVCAFLGDKARAALLYDLLLPYAGRTVVVGGNVVCYGAASRYLGLLAATMGQWEKAIRHFEKALSMNTSMGAYPWLAHTQHAYAMMLLTRNKSTDRPQALELLHNACTIARELGMKELEERVSAQITQHTTPSGISLSNFNELSQREQDVLRLLAVGKSNREIAAELYISLSTVATHVRSILTKTNTANRTEAAAYAMRQGYLPPS